MLQWLTAWQVERQRANQATADRLESCVALDTRQFRRLPAVEANGPISHLQ